MLTILSKDNYLACHVFFDYVVIYLGFSIVTTGSFWIHRRFGDDDIVVAVAVRRFHEGPAYFLSHQVKLGHDL